MCVSVYRRVYDRGGIASGDFLGRKNFKLPGDSTVGNFGQLGADGRFLKLLEQVQNRFHWDKALGG